ncbi:hypothetical protein M2480_003196 [Parabacteroides sp. PFB2-12]|uniref:hypothetical protein n=1 Tax=unclassified Parabacteroides TaxID=2649774 RepID=UPI0024761C3D|nr:MULTISPECIES: hypothetical protein [unclassified Parabacteroides]MDH6344293.1 hypothetical protein [Parabacteroides sp. PM6-13]MDH6392188.1 hypothetical protein [Parabacteroides sp. PFB2-12]
MRKKKVLLWACLCFVTQTLFAATVNFNLTGLQSGDQSVVSFGSDSYLDTKTITVDGSYSFTNVPAGTYFIKIEANGYNLPNAQTVVVKEDGSFEPKVGIKIAITKMKTDPDTWTHSWSEDVSTSGYTTTSYVNNPPTIDFLGKKIVPSNVPSVGILYDNHKIILADDKAVWTQEYAYRLMETLKTIPYSYDYRDNVPAKFILTEESLYNDIVIEEKGGAKEVTISKDVFYYANPFLVNLDGVRGRFYSKRLHHALVRYVTDNGDNRERINTILRERFGCTTDVPDYEELTKGITNEDAGRFQEFHSSELVAIINMFEELPEGFHKTPHLNYLIRRMNGHKHPIYPEAAAVAWPVDNGYIEFMENAFGGDNNQFETQRLILHEKTHFLWAFSFSDEIKNDWIELGGWYKDPNVSSGWSTTKNTEFVSAYAHAKNPDEDMAESVAHYLKNPELLQSRSLPKYEFIRDRIMHGTRYISKIPDYLTFEVLNLYPDYDYPGKIKRLDVKVEGAPEEDKLVTVEIELNHMEGFEDGASNARTRISSLFIDTNGEERSQYYDMHFEPVDDNQHLLRGVIIVSKYSKSGFWMAGDILVTDMQGNQRFEGRNDYVWNMYVSNPLEDVEPPKYEKGSLNYTVTDTIIEGHVAQNLAVRFKVTDNVGMLEGQCVIARLYRGDGTYSWGDKWGYYDTKTQIATINYTITEYFVSADYYVESLGAIDYAKNAIDIRFSDSPLDEPIKKIYIQTPNPDKQAPELDLNRITVYAEPTNKSKPDGETLVTVHFYTRDDKAGLGRVSYTLRDPQGIDHFQWHYHDDFYGLFPKEDPTVWRKQTIKCILPQGSAPGIWGLSAISLEDKALNARTYNFVETLIFEPDNSTTDYVLFSEMKEDGMIYLKISSESQSNYGFNYRVINENTGVEINGNVNRTSSSVKTTEINASSLGNDPLLVIVQIKNAAGEVVAVRSSYIEERNVTSILHPERKSSDLTIRGGEGQIFIIAEKQRMVNIYHISGRLVCQTTVNEGTNIIFLSPGIYAVEREKVIVR